MASEREARIEAWLKRANTMLNECEDDEGRAGSPREVEESVLDEALALMRTAPSAAPASAGRAVEELAARFARLAETQNSNWIAEGCPDDGVFESGLCHAAMEFAEKVHDALRAELSPEPSTDRVVPPELEDFASRALDNALGVDRDSSPSSLHGWASTVERLARGILDLARDLRKPSLEPQRAGAGLVEAVEALLGCDTSYFADKDKEYGHMPIERLKAFSMRKHELRKALAAEQARESDGRDSQIAYLLETLWMVCDATGTRRDAVSARQIPSYVDGMRTRARDAEERAEKAEAARAELLAEIDRGHVAIDRLFKVGRQALTPDYRSMVNMTIEQRIVRALPSCVDDDLRPWIEHQNTVLTERWETIQKLEKALEELTLAHGRGEQALSDLARLREQVEALRGEAVAVVECLCDEPDTERHLRAAVDLVRDLAALPTEPDGSKADAGGVPPDGKPSNAREAAIRAFRRFWVSEVDLDGPRPEYEQTFINRWDDERSLWDRQDAGGVAVLRRLRLDVDSEIAALPARKSPEQQARCDAFHLVGRHIDRLLAEAESQPEGEARVCGGCPGCVWGDCAEGYTPNPRYMLMKDDNPNRDGPARPMPTETFSEDEPERDGDDVLRKFLDDYEKFSSTGVNVESADTVAVLAKRALEGR